MRIKLVLTQTFESDFNDKHYFIYQFVDPQTLTILSLSSTDDLVLNQGQEYDCTLGIKRSKLVVIQVNSK